MDSSILTIRHAVREDIPNLLDLYEHLTPGDQKPSIDEAAEVFERFMSYRGSAIFLGEVNGRLVSSCTLVIVPNLTHRARPYGLVENVVTHTDHRHQGFGTQVLDAASDTAWACDCYKIMLMTGSKKPETLAFYLRAGFEQSKTGFQKRRIPVRVES